MSVGGTSSAERAGLLPREEFVLEYLARIKIHNPTEDGVLVELNGEFDLSCLEAFKRSLVRARSLGEPVFVDLSGVGFMDGLCARELLHAAEGDGFELCQPSPQVRLSALACGLGGRLVACSPDDERYEAVIREACRPQRKDGNGPRAERELHTSGAPYVDA